MTEDLQKISDKDITSLVHEMQAHQIELEMQNEELRRVQKELEDTRNRYSDLYDFAPISYFTFDRMGLILEVNLTGAKKLGRERAYLIKTPFSLYIHGNKDAFYSHLREVFNTNKTQMVFELKLVDNKGNIFDAKLESITVQDSDGNLLCRTAMSNITESKLAEKVSQEARIYAENILDTVREPFVVLDKDLKVLSANHSFYSTFEVTHDETVGNLIYDIGNRQWDIPSLRTLLEEILPKNTQFINYEVSHKFQTIGQKIMLLNARQIYQEVIGIPIILLAIEDITERKRAEKVSQEARIYAENIIETVREPFVVLDKDLKVLSANHSFYSTFEVTPDETVGNLIYDIGNRQWDIPSLRTLLEEILPKNTQFINYEVSHKFQTIGQKIMLLNARQIYQEVIGTPIILLAIEDITQRKKAEEKLKQTLEELERSNKDLEQFAYAASHDLQEPLRTVSNFSQLLAKRYKSELDEKADQFIGFIVDGTTRMQEMIDNLLAYSRITTLAKPFQPTNCETVFDQVLANVKMAIEESGAMVTHDPLPTVMADTSQMVQIFQNLLSNAIKFRKEKPHIMVSAVQRENEWLFSVKDNGIGIAPEFMEHIFKMYQREHSSAQFQGTGIGLAICRKIVERHGGRIWVESEIGNGSTFYFTIPVKGGGQS